MMMAMMTVVVVVSNHGDDDYDGRSNFGKLIWFDSNAENKIKTATADSIPISHIRKFLYSVLCTLTTIISIYYLLIINYYNYWKYTLYDTE